MQLNIARVSITAFSFLTAGVAIVGGSGTARADVKLPALFSDNMVLQRDMPVPFWGTAEAGEEVAVTIGRKTMKTKADGSGHWSLRFPKLKPGAPRQVIVAGKNTVSLKNVLVGDVWLASGQSNMVWPVSLSLNSEKEIAASTDPALRVFTVAYRAVGEPQADTVGAWQEASPQTTGNFTGVGYFFARELRKVLGVPIGIINSSVGGTVAQAWTSRPALAADSELRKAIEYRETVIAAYPQAKAEYDKKLADWETAATAAKAAGQAEPAKPTPPVAPDNPNLASALYNGMIAPLVPYGIKGVIWYQGESNGLEPELYRKLFPNLIANWRRDWGQGDFPFLFVQLANYLQQQTQPSEGGWALLREAQTMALKVPHTGMAVTIDVGEANDIHPKNKQEVGHRLALAAQHVAYGRKLAYSGPLYDSMQIEGNRIRLRFKHTDGGLQFKGDKLQGFGIAGADGKFVWADATIDGNTVVVSSPQVPNPTTVHYSWAYNPIGNLYNKAGLPASSFRTDGG